jgi:hypothetical protein
MIDHVHRSKLAILPVLPLYSPLTHTAITVGMILVTAVLTGTGQSDEETVGLRKGDSSWRDILGEWPICSCNRKPEVAADGQNRRVTARN